MDCNRIKTVKYSLNNNEMYFYFYIRQKYVDTVIKCSNGAIKVHSTIIKHNNVFNNLLSSSRNKNVHELDFSQFSMEVMRVVIEYIYRGDSRYFREIQNQVENAIDYFFNDANSKVTSTVANSNSLIEVQEADVETIVLSDSDDNETLCKDVEKAKESTSSPPKTKRNDHWITSIHRNNHSPRKKYKNPVAFARDLMKNSNKEDKNELHKPSHSRINPASNTVSSSRSQQHEKSDKKDCYIISDSEGEDKLQKSSRTEQTQKLNNRNQSDIVYESTDDEDSVTLKILKENRSRTRKRKTSRLKFTFQVEKHDEKQFFANKNESISKNSVQESVRCIEIEETSENTAPTQKIIIHKSTVISKSTNREPEIDEDVENSTLTQNKYLENPVLVVALDRLSSAVFNKFIEHSPSDDTAMDLENTSRNEELPTSPLNGNEAIVNISLPDSQSNSPEIGGKIENISNAEDENGVNNKHFKKKGKKIIKTTPTKVNLGLSINLRKYSRCRHCLEKYPRSREFFIHERNCEKVM